ncbi:uncharacterized protein LOC108742452, partial [Agrilus planipennis]|uniref:Uncharacterized protein LOC108742452 n=1 Tax=Agrilus planipennis TaxID=224129 RepID=A0A7F5RC48_AGRPL
MGNFRHFLILCAAAISTVSPIDLPNAVTSKPKHPKPPTTASGNGTNIKVTSDYVQYSVKESDGSTCILFRADAMIEVHFKSPIGNDRDDAYFPVNANISGECNDDDGLLRIVWSGYDLKFIFKKTPGGERWYIKEIDLVVDSATPRYHEIKHKLGKSFKLTHTTMLFLTPVGKSYSCDDITVNLDVPIEDKNPAGLRGVLLLRKFQFVQQDVNFCNPVNIYGENFFYHPTASCGGPTKRYDLEGAYFSKEFDIHKLDKALGEKLSIGNGNDKTAAVAYHQAAKGRESYCGTAGGKVANSELDEILPFVQQDVNFCNPVNIYGENFFYHPTASCGGPTKRYDLEGAYFSKEFDIHKLDKALGEKLSIGNGNDKTAAVAYHQAAKGRESYCGTAGGKVANSELDEILP